MVRAPACPPHAFPNSPPEVRAHADPKLWPNSEDPALEHPMSHRMMQILETYKRLYKETGKPQPMIKSARYAPSR